MSAAIDLLQREIASLKKVLNARDRGIPSQLAVIVRGEAAKTPEGRAEAVKKALQPYGLETIEDAQAAGCDVRMACLPWLHESARNIPKPTWPVGDSSVEKNQKQPSTDIQSVDAITAEANTKKASSTSSADQDKTLETDWKQ